MLYINVIDLDSRLTDKAENLVSRLYSIGYKYCGNYSDSNGNVGRKVSDNVFNDMVRNGTIIEYKADKGRQAMLAPIGDTLYVGLNNERASEKLHLIYGKQVKHIVLALPNSEYNLFSELQVHKIDAQADDNIILQEILELVRNVEREDA